MSDPGHPRQRRAHAHLALSETSSLLVPLCGPVLKVNARDYLHYLKERHIDCIIERIISSSPSAIIREDINIYDERLVK